MLELEQGCELPAQTIGYPVVGWNSIWCLEQHNILAAGNPDVIILSYKYFSQPLAPKPATNL